MIDFSPAIYSLVTYQKKFIKSMTSEQKDLLNEAFLRLRFLQYAINECIKRHLKTHDEGWITLCDELQFYSESFYYFAFRLVTILTLLPHISKSFKDKCKNIVIVRNKLMEHSQSNDSKILMNSLLVGDAETGPIIKPVRLINDTIPFHDKGLFINARNLIESICNTIETIINSNNK